MVHSKNLPTFSTLPEDVLLEIMSHLDVRSLARLEIAHKRSHGIVNGSVALTEWKKNEKLNFGNSSGSRFLGAFAQEMENSKSWLYRNFFAAVDTIGMPVAYIANHASGTAPSPYVIRATQRAMIRQNLQYHEQTVMRVIDDLDFYATEEDTLLTRVSRAQQALDIPFLSIGNKLSIVSKSLFSRGQNNRAFMREPVTNVNPIENSTNARQRSAPSITL